ncbi:MAG: hypothetical protein QW822_02750 [Desulfurococcaceae archaeon]
MQDVLNILFEKIRSDSVIGIIPVSTVPWGFKSVVNRLNEEIGVTDYIVLTRRGIASVLKAMINDLYLENREDGKELNIYIDVDFSKSTLKNDVFADLFIIESIVSGIALKARKIAIDTTFVSSNLSFALQFIKTRHPGLPVIFTHVDQVSLPNIPSYPKSPRWIHKVYVYYDRANEIGVNECKENPMDKLSKRMAWSGTKGLFEEISLILNKLSCTRYMEVFDEGKREELSDISTIDVFIDMPSMEEKKRYISLDVNKGLDENTASMMMSNWRTLLEAIATMDPNIDRNALERILMQIQRYTGAVDLIVREVENNKLDLSDYSGYKLHIALCELAGRSRKPIAFLADTNLFYQGVNMVLLKASIKQGKPWSSIQGMNIYIPSCAESEIINKVTENSNASTGIHRYSYIMALLAHRALEEVENVYLGTRLHIANQPCEASLGGVSRLLGEGVVLIATADKRAFNAWRTLDICKDKVVCIYIGHKNKPINIDNIFSKLYASVVLSLQIYIASLFTPIEIIGKTGGVKLSLSEIEGNQAPVISITPVSEKWR